MRQTENNMLHDVDFKHGYGLRFANIEEHIRETQAPVKSLITSSGDALSKYKLIANR